MINLDFTKRWRKGRTVLVAHIWSCSTTCHRLSLRIQMQNGGGQATINNCDLKDFSAVTKSDVLDLCNRVNVISCKRCGRPAFDPASVETNRAGLCESCFMSDLRARFAVADAAEQSALAKKDAAKLALGFTHRVSVWVHPHKGGDDRLLDLYFRGKPTSYEIRAEARSIGTLDESDYGITELSTRAA